MPCTTEGLIKIKNFEDLMLRGTKNGEHVRSVFRSAIRREMHGATESSMAVPDPAFEEIVVKGIRDIITMHPNPNFRGHSSRAAPVETDPEEKEGEVNVQRATGDVEMEGVMEDAKKDEHGEKRDSREKESSPDE